jgi:hypothetical protein
MWSGGESKLTPNRGEVKSTTRGAQATTGCCEAMLDGRVSLAFATRNSRSSLFSLTHSLSHGCKLTIALTLSPLPHFLASFLHLHRACSNRVPRPTYCCALYTLTPAHPHTHTGPHTPCTYGRYRKRVPTEGVQAVTVKGNHSRFAFVSRRGHTPSCHPTRQSSRVHWVWGHASRKENVL